MKTKLLIGMMMAAGICCLSSCEKKCSGDFGDFSIKPTISVEPQMVSIDGSSVYELKVLRSFDTVFPWRGIQCKFTQMEPIILPAKADTFNIFLKSNAKWVAPVPDAGGKVQWYFNYNTLTGTTSTGGGGDGQLGFRVSRNKNYARTVKAHQYIYTSDSTVMYQLTFGQIGEKNK